MMKPNKIREMTTVELEQELANLKTELFKLRFQNATKQLDNPMRISAIKKDIARVKTIMVENAKKAEAAN